VRLAQLLEKTGREVTELRLVQMARDLESSESGDSGRMRGGEVQQPAPQPAPPRLNRRYEGPPPNRNRGTWGRRLEELESTNLPIPRIPFLMFGGDPGFGLRNV
jgi:hypothetical protein